MPQSNDFEPKQHSSLRYAVSQLESLKLTSDVEPSPVDSSALSSRETSANPSTASSPSGESAPRGRGSDLDHLAPHAPYFGASTPLCVPSCSTSRRPSSDLVADLAEGSCDSLKELDSKTSLSRKSSKAPTRAPSVTGIGSTGELPSRQPVSSSVKLILLDFSVSKPDYSGAKIVVAMVRAFTLTLNATRRG